MLGPRPDVMVVGGGPAGLAVAIAARLKGFSVVVIDAAHPPIDKACGEGVLPAGIDALRRLGVPLSTREGFPFRGVCFFGGGTTVAGTFQAGIGLAVRRTRLHEILADRASEVGVRLHWGTRITHASGYSACRWLVGADGQNSCVRAASALDASSQESLRFGFRRHYRVAPWTDFVEVHWGARCQVYVTPTSQDEVGVAVLSRDSHLRLESALEEFPELQTRLHRAETSSAERGAAILSRQFRRVCRGQTALVGDASGSVDPITGGGLSLAFLQAGALSEALCRDDLRYYEASHRRLSRRPARMSSFLLALDRLPLIRHVVLRVLALRPVILGKFLTNVCANA